MRANLNATISSAIARAAQRPFLKQYCKTVIGRGNLSNDQDMLDELYDYMMDNALRVQSRVPLYNTPVAGTNTGNGQIIRLTRDERNQNIESFWRENKRARCIADRSTGTDIGRELFQFVGQTPEPDELRRSGSGLQSTVVGLTTDDSLIDNASWSSFGGTAAAPTSITSWTSSTTVNSTNYSFDATNYFRAAPSDGTTSYALNAKVTTLLSQAISIRGTKLREDVPYLLAVAWNRAVGSASGTLVLRMGQANTSVAVSAQTGWNVTLVPSPIGQSAWYRQFQQNDVSIDVQWTRTGGELLIDDVLFVPGTLFDGHWYWIIPNSAASNLQFRVNDSFTWGDAVTATTGKIQTWIWRAWNRHLPSSNGSAITWSDP